MNRREMLKTAVAVPLAAVATPSPQIEEMSCPMEKLPIPPEPKWHPFHSRQDLDRAAALTPAVHSDWYFNISAGDTIKEKYDSLRGMVEATRHFLHNCGPEENYFGHSMIMSPEVASIFHDCNEGYEFHDPVFYDGGKIWRSGWHSWTALYVDELFDKSLILVRRNVTDERDKDVASNYGRIRLHDFIF